MKFPKWPPGLEYALTPVAAVVAGVALRQHEWGLAVIALCYVAQDLISLWRRL